MSALIHIYYSFSAMLIGTVMVLAPFTMRQDHCSDYVLNTYVKGGFTLIGISSLIFIVAVSIEVKEFIKRRYQWRQSRWRVS